MLAAITVHCLIFEEVIYDRKAEYFEILCVGFLSDFFVVVARKLARQIDCGIICGKCDFVNFVLRWTEVEQLWRQKKWRKPENGPRDKQHHRTISFELYSSTKIGGNHTTSLKSVPQNPDWVGSLTLCFGVTFFSRVFFCSVLLSCVYGILVLPFGPENRILPAHTSTVRISHCQATNTYAQRYAVWIGVCARVCVCELVADVCVRAKNILSKPRTHTPNRASYAVRSPYTCSRCIGMRASTCEAYSLT